jgi:hypothetical protein
MGKETILPLKIEKRLIKTIFGLIAIFLILEIFLFGINHNFETKKKRGCFD